MGCGGAAPGRGLGAGQGRRRGTGARVFGAAPGRLAGGFHMGEERVRKIALGSPAAPSLAVTPPLWAGCARPAHTWRAVPV